MTVRLRAKAIVTDIEGTTGSIAFVRDVLFPYADANLESFVAMHNGQPAVARTLQDAAREAALELSDQAGILAALHRWIEQDAKVTALKALQGLIWAEGYGTGELKGHVYDDAVRGLRRWHAAGLPLFVYSSGSVAAQRLLFGHSTAGDLRPLFTGYFDTTVGSKREARSYARVAEEIGASGSDIVFLSDSVAELEAARTADMLTVQLTRVADGTVSSRDHSAVTTFDEIEVELKA